MSNAKHFGGFTNKNVCNLTLKVITPSVFATFWQQQSETHFLALCK